MVLAMLFCATCVFGDVTLVAHRGYCKAAPENTIAAFQAARKAGFRWIEVDVQESRDGFLLIMHDSTVNRTTNGRGFVSRMKGKDILSLRIDAGNGNPDTVVYRVPTLVQTLNCCRKYGLCPILHVKGVRSFQNLDMVCSRYPFYRNIIYQCTAQDALKLKAVNPRAQIMGLHMGVESVAAAMSTYLFSNAGIRYMNVHSSALTPGNLRYLDKKMVMCSGWDVNDLAKGLSAYHNGCKWIITDEITPDAWKKYFDANTLPQVKLSSVKQQDKSVRRISVAWQKQEGVTGYEVACATNGSLVGSARGSADYNTTSAVIAVSATGRYYVSVRCWKRKNNTTVYSDWTKPVAVVVR